MLRLLGDDRATMPHYAYDRLRAGKLMPGVFVLADRVPMGQAIEELSLLAACSEQTEWIRRVVYLPL